MIIAIHQPNFLPWMGYFWKIARVDSFVFLDDVQFSKGSYQNRVQIKGPQGVNWLTVPIVTNGRLGQATDVVEIDSTESWIKRHLQTWRSAYGRAHFFRDLFPYLEAIYISRSWINLVAFNITLIQRTCELLGINTPCTLSSQLDAPQDRDRRLLAICQALGANRYLHGKGSSNYLNHDVFQQHGVQPVGARFSHPHYHQPWGIFVEGLSIWDVLFNCGVDQTREWFSI